MASFSPDDLCKDLISKIRSHSEILRVRTSIWEFGGGYNSTHNPYKRPVAFPLLLLDDSLRGNIGRTVNRTYGKVHMAGN